MADTVNNEADPKETDKAKAMWLGFTDLMKYSIAGVVALLVLMAIFLV
jgi:hypothetical protein